MWMSLSARLWVASLLLVVNRGSAFVSFPRPVDRWSCRSVREEALTSATSTVAPSSAADLTGNLWEELLSRFQGDFDNYNQVVEDREADLLPREGGGHEHIHCTLVPVSKDSRLAAFYFDGQPNAIFRFRFYKLIPQPEEDAVDTVLYTLDPDLEALIRQCPDPLDWPAIFHAQDGFDRISVLPKCEVRWSWVLDPVQHAYASSHRKTDTIPGIHALMVYGEALVESQMMQGVQILIRDQLSLWNDEFWIHDRGFDPVTMKFIYGNQREVPYRLERVASMASVAPSVPKPERHIVNTDLSWTLGADYRTEELYEGKLAKVGGPSLPKRR
jgi:hypothetical protein